MVTVSWKGNMAFEADTPSGKSFLMDAPTDSGGEGKGPTPLEAFLAALAACSGIDVISILQKKQQKVTSYRIEVTGSRTAEGVYPRPFVSMTVKHILDGENLDPQAVERAIELTDTKYCTVLSTLRAKPEVVTEWSIVQS